MFSRRLSHVLLTSAFLFAASGFVFGAEPDGDCATCHEDIHKKIQPGVHASLGCTTCHDNHEKYPHPAKAEKPQCSTCHDKVAADHAASVHGRELKKGNAGAPNCDACHGTAHEAVKTTSMDFRKQVPDTCGMCHDEVAKQFKESVHGKAIADGIPQAPICNDCHGEHSIQSPKSTASPVHSSHIRETCARCHADVKLASRFGLPADRITTFDTSFHGLAAQTGSQTVANCASCHGIHNILPSSDAKSTINTKNLPKTCGNCHPGAGSRFALGTIHWSQDNKEPEGAKTARLIYLLLIPATVGFMLLHNFGDYFKKLMWLRLKTKNTLVAPALPPPAREHRMFGMERMQHALLAVSFMVLVYTGFSLKYPNEWWSKPILQWEAAYSMRGLVHRIAGAVMTAVAFLHMGTLIISRKLRHHWLEMIPRWTDAVEMFQMTAYNIGFRQTKPVLSSHSYIEKMEYWAVVWGTFVMALSGGLLWFNSFALSRMPKEWLDILTTVHFYEAVLATLSILVWHFYFVIFDPEVYPMDPAWLTGFSVRRRKAHGAEHSARVAASTKPVPEPAAGD